MLLGKVSEREEHSRHPRRGRRRSREGCPPAAASRWPPCIWNSRGWHAGPHRQPHPDRKDAQLPVRACAQDGRILGGAGESAQCRLLCANKREAAELGGADPLVRAGRPRPALRSQNQPLSAGDRRPGGRPRTGASRPTSYAKRATNSQSKWHWAKAPAQPCCVNRGYQPPILRVHCQGNLIQVIIEEGLIVVPCLTGAVPNGGRGENCVKRAGPMMLLRCSFVIKVRT